MTIFVYRIIEFDGGFEPQMEYMPGALGIKEAVWFPLNSHGYWLEPEAFSNGVIRQRAPLATRWEAEQVIARAKLINSDEKIIRNVEP